MAGADGLALDVDGSFIVAVEPQNRIARVRPTGEIASLVEGGPLDNPASVVVDSRSQPRRLLITNASFFSAPGAAAGPGLLTLPLE